MRTSAAVAILLLAGCLGIPDATLQGLEGLEEGVFVADESGLAPAGDLPGVTVTQEDRDTTYVIDWMAFTDPDVLKLVLVQALADQTLDTYDDLDLTYAPARVAGEGREGTDFCLFRHGEYGVPGEGYLARAMGQDAPLASEGDRQYLWMRASAAPSPIVTSFGFSFGSSMLAMMEAGQWLLFGAGESGIPATDYHDAGNTWTLTVVAPGPVRVILLTSTQLACGSGLARFGGTTSGPLTVGGRLDVQDRYGATVAFEGRGELVQDSGVALGASEGTLMFGDEEVALHDLSNVWRETYDAVPVALAIEQWVGSPTWTAMGFSAPHPPELGLDDGGNGTRILHGRSPAPASARVTFSAT